MNTYLLDQNWWDSLPQYWRTLFFNQAYERRNRDQSKFSNNWLQEIVNELELSKKLIFNWDSVSNNNENFLIEYYLFNEKEKYNPLIDLKNLIDLKFYGDTLSDLSVINGLSKLIKLELSGYNIYSIYYLSSLESLEELDIYAGCLSDLEPLSSLQNLKKLSLSGYKLKELEPLSHLKNLNYLSIDLNRNAVDLSPIKELIDNINKKGGKVQIA